MVGWLAAGLNGGLNGWMVVRRVNWLLKWLDGCQRVNWWLKWFDGCQNGWMAA